MNILMGTGQELLQESWLVKFKMIYFMIYKMILRQSMQIQLWKSNRVRKNEEGEGSSVDVNANGK